MTTIRVTYWSSKKEPQKFHKVRYMAIHSTDIPKSLKLSWLL